MIAPDAMAADANGDVDSNDIYLLITAGFCCVAAFKGYSSGLQR